MGVIIGLDVGTTTTKAVAIDPDSSWRAAAYREYGLEEPHPQWQVQDPGTLLAAADAALAEVVAACEGREIDVIGVGSAMHALIGLDEDLRPVTDIITWADTRGHDGAAKLRAEGRARELLHRSGTPVHPMSPLVKLMWFDRHHQATLRGTRWWVGIKELVLAHLTGRLVTELSSASATGLLDLGTRTWADSSLSLAGVRPEQLPDVLATTAMLELAPAAASRVGLPAGTPVNVGATDGPLGNLGTGAVEPGVAGMSIGTSGAVRILVPEPKMDAGGRLFCYALTEDAWVVGGSISNGGVVMRWAADVLTQDLPGEPARDSDVLEIAAQAPPGSDGLIMLPFLLGERAPLWDPELTGSFLGVRHAHGRQHFLRAALEGVCLQMAGLVDVLDDVTPVTQVRCTGGVFRSELWRGVMAATLGRPLVPTDDAEGSALGSAILALYATGQVGSLAEGLERLGPGDGVADPVEVSAADRAVYEGLRDRAVGYLHAYGELQEYLEGIAAKHG